MVLPLGGGDQFRDVVVAEAPAKALLRWSATEREAWLDAVINDPLLPSDYLGQQARWPSARTDGGWQCPGTPAEYYARSIPNSCPDASDYFTEIFDRNRISKSFGAMNTRARPAFRCPSSPNFPRLNKSVLAV